jgi:hypothetical protein
MIGSQSSKSAREQYSLHSSADEIKSDLLKSWQMVNVNTVSISVIARWRKCNVSDSADFNGVADRPPHRVANPYIEFELASHVGPELLKQVESSL